MERGGARWRKPYEAAEEAEAAAAEVAAMAVTTAAVATVAAREAAGVTAAVVVVTAPAAHWRRAGRSRRASCRTGWLGCIVAWGAVPRPHSKRPRAGALVTACPHDGQRG